jgi:hypothetical protein
MRIFHIAFLKNGSAEPCTKNYLGVDVGNAISKWKRDFPDAKLISEYSEARVGGHHLGHVTYEPVSTAKPEPLPEVKAEERTFSFFADCISHRPSLG